MLTTPHIRTLLIADADPVFLRSLTRAMKRRGYVVCPCGSLAEVRRALTDGFRPQFAILELRLDDASGLEAAALLAADAASCRMVVLTGYGSLETAVAAAKLGIADYLAKPVTADIIEAALLGRPAGLVEGHQFPRPDEQEFSYLLTMFERHDRNLSETARAIGMHRRTLQRILRRHGVSPRERSSDEPVSPRRKLIRLYRLWTRLLDDGSPGPARPSPERV